MCLAFRYCSGRGEVNQNVAGPAGEAAASPTGGKAVDVD